MSQSSGGGGTFEGVYNAFREECNRYTQRKKIKVSGKTVRPIIYPDDRTSPELFQSKLFNMTPSEPIAEQLTFEGFASLMQQIDVFIFGADALLWLRDGVITDAANLVNLLIEEKKEVFIVTNDTTNSRDSHEEKLRKHRFNKKLNKVTCQLLQIFLLPQCRRCITVKKFIDDSTCRQNLSDEPHDYLLT
ncbi:unnamed protein product [Strongylus vulgaris]|uniref:Uncharacterized protein n=1 Tax=Strongylus vulgaris TaxID=40348 RepID=A0A3P7IY81_STRVU|nr:unnamed protein product [Strongylus vulgaris]